jgi:PIN domain nuclease of toxin-antitoxin system
MILDTCALLWLASGDPRLSDDAREAIESSNHLGVCAISAFEIGQKYYKNKLLLPESPERWFSAILEFYELPVFKMDHQIAIRATELPGHHADPCDRIIVATAQILNLAIVTSDTKIAKYGVKTLC